MDAGRAQLAVLLVATLAMGAPACDGDDDDTPEPPPPTAEQPQPGPEPRPRHRPAVILSLDRDTARPGETLELTVENTTRKRLEYGVAYRLGRRVDGRWRWINRDSAFILILEFVGPGQRKREEIKLPRDLEPGRYRIVKSFTAPDGELRASVEFTVT